MSDEKSSSPIPLPSAVEPPPKRKRGRPKGPAKPYTISSGSGAMLQKLADGTPSGAARRHDERTVVETDATCSEDDWKLVYKHWGASGSAAELSRMTGLPRKKVQHLINIGVKRLGLPAIRVHATDYDQVNLRTAQIVGDLPAPPEAEESLTTVMPDLRKAVTDRATREAAVSQGLLMSVMQTVDTLLGYSQEFLKKAQDPEGGYLVPGAITLGAISELTKAINTLSNAANTAVRLSRFAAGEPDQTIALQVASIFVGMSTEEVQHYLKTKELPAHLRIAGGAGSGDTIDVDSK